jgi:hypothetical protein
VTDSRKPGSDLPAEYVDPWRLLRRDLRALLASLRLRLQELWRRNRQADLWRPGFWPAVLAAWFWPLLLVLLLLAPIGLLLWQPASPASDNAPQPTSSGIGNRGPAEPPLAESLPPQQESVAPPREPAPVLEPAATEPVLPEPLRDPLLVTLEPDATPLLLLEACPSPAEGLLRLTVAEEFARLPAGQRRQRALEWWADARNLGYERLELRDRRSQLLARSALVGEGLVLFDGAGEADT